jgi:hypothetical protein
MKKTYTFYIFKGYYSAMTKTEKIGNWDLFVIDQSAANCKIQSLLKMWNLWY